MNLSFVPDKSTCLRPALNRKSEIEMTAVRADQEPRPEEMPFDEPIEEPPEAPNRYAEPRPTETPGPLDPRPSHSPPESRLTHRR
jgi:hypothetical protein